MGAAEDVSLACAYAALILHDGGQKVDAGAIDKMLAAANVEAAGFDACLFEKALTGASVKDLIEAASQVGGGGGGGGAAPAAAAAAPAAAAKKAAPPPEEEETMDFDLFG